MKLFSHNQAIDLEKQLLAVKDLLAGLEPALGWASRESVEATAEKVLKSLPGDLKNLKKQARFIFLPSEDADGLARNNVRLLRRWHAAGEAPSLVAMCIHAAEQFHLQLDPDALQRLLIAGTLGEVENPLPYHNNLHYKKVLLQLLQLIAVHNGIYDGTKRALTVEQIALLMVAACVHDLGHDGRGNTIKGVFQAGRLERRSFDIAAYYFKAAGCGDEAAMAIVRAMLLTTDVSPLGDPANLMNQMKSAYRRRFFGSRGQAELLNLDPELKTLEQDEAMAIMCLLMHEADIATSAGLDYEVTKYETALYRLEIGESEARPQHVVDFLNDVCQRRMLSDAGQQLYAANMARIFALAEEDIKNGNQVLPAPEHSGFILGTVAATDQSGQKTIN